MTTPQKTVRPSRVGDRGKPEPPPLQRQTVATLTLTAIRDRILRGDYPEGKPLRQDAIATELGVSRIPVREALRQLEAEGLVTLSPHVGAVVSMLSLGEIREIFELRALIEVELLRRAVPRTQESHLAHAEEILDRYEKAFDRGDIATWGTLNSEFHSALYGPAQQPLTLGIVQNLQNQSDRYFRMHLSLENSRIRANDEHRAIVKAIREKDEQYAVALLNAHILVAGRSLLEFLHEHRVGMGTEV